MTQVLGDQARVIRVMPNTPCLISKCASAYAPNTAATTDDVHLVHQLMSSVGVTVQVQVHRNE